MRALRSSLWASAYEPPITTVLLESDVVDTLESITAGAHRPFRMLVIHEIFDAADDLVVASTEAVQRQQANAEQEAHQAMLFYWAVLKWALLREGGMLLMDKPAPLSREEIEVVFAQLAQHPEYKKFHIVTHTRDMDAVELIDGEIKEVD